MGPEDSKKKEIMFYMIVDGQRVEVVPDFAEITFAEGQQGNDNLKLDNCEFSIRVNLPKSMRCKSRKRFVKLLIASGLNRNEAQALARGSVVLRNQRGVPEYMKASYQSCFIDFWLRGLVRLGERKG